MLSIVALELQTVEIPQSVTGTACRNDLCIEFAFSDGALSSTPNGYMIVNQEEDSTFNLEIDRADPGARFSFFLRGQPNPKDGDVYSVKLQKPSGEVLADVSTPVTYEPPSSDPCEVRHYSALVVIE